MPKKTTILAFAGSARNDSWNKKLIRVAAEGARAAGAVVTEIDLADYPMPIYDGDLEAAEGQPNNAKMLKALMVDNDGFLIASPEYNSGYSPLLKNAIDWTSRPVPNETRLIAFAGKTAALMSASPGILGGLRGLVQLRQVLSNIQVLVLPDQVTLPTAQNAFNNDGDLADKVKHQETIKLGAKLANLLYKLQA